MKFHERVISDFGGYEKCKDILSQLNIDLIMNAQALREHMLEYRRQHNIFEVGDKVTMIGDIMLGVFSVVEIRPVGCYWSIRCKNGSHEITLIKQQLRHADDEEIKAGTDYETETN